MAILCFCPPESLTPLSPATVSSFLGSFAMKLMGIGGMNGLLDFLHVLRFAMGDVIDDGIVEKDHILRDEGDVSPERRDGDVPYVDPVEA